jgi:chromosome segregation ATPase
MVTPTTPEDGMNAWLIEKGLELVALIASAAGLLWKIATVSADVRGGLAQQRAELESLERRIDSNQTVGDKRHEENQRAINEVARIQAGAPTKADLKDLRSEILESIKDLKTIVLNASR